MKDIHFKFTVQVPDDADPQIVRFMYDQLVWAGSLERDWSPSHVLITSD